MGLAFGFKKQSKSVGGDTNLRKYCTHCPTSILIENSGNWEVMVRKLEILWQSTGTMPKNNNTICKRMRTDSPLPTRQFFSHIGNDNFLFKETNDL
jgi:hypothetical protein